MTVKLTWNECRPGEEWQAGGLGSHFSIIKNDAGSFSIRRAIGDEPSGFVGMAKTLEYAKTLCEHVVNKVESSTGDKSTCMHCGATIYFNVRIKKWVTEKDWWRCANDLKNFPVRAHTPR